MARRRRPVPPLPSQIDRGLAGRVGKGAEATAPRRLDPLLFFDRPRLPDHFPAPRAVLLEKSGPSSTLRPELRSNGDQLGGSGREARRRRPVPPLPFSSSPPLDSRPRFPSPQPLESEPQCPWSRPRSAPSRPRTARCYSRRLEARVCVPPDRNAAQCSRLP